MQEKKHKKSNFFDRISQIIDFYEIKNVKSFACDYLGYKSPQKINRLKEDGTSPSYEILNDISNKFENVNPDWLLTGKGEMLRGAQAQAPQELLEEIRAEKEREIARIRAEKEAEIARIRAEKDAEIKEMTRELNREIGRLEERLKNAQESAQEWEKRAEYATASKRRERELVAL